MDIARRRILGGILMVLTPVIAAGISLWITENEKETYRTSELSVLADVTEPLLSWPDEAEIIAHFDLEARPHDGAEFRFRIISDVSVNAETALALPESGNRLLESSFERKREVKAFEDSVTAFLTRTTRDTAIGRPRSSIIHAVAAEAGRLAAGAADTRTLLIYSDLMENADVSFYDPHTLALMRTDPDSLASLLTAHEPLGDLSGIRIYLIFQPRSAVEDQRFRQVSSFYKTLFESRGATVTVAANLTR